MLAQRQIAEAQSVQTRASILLELDRRWESETMLKARAELREIMSSVREEASKRWPGLPPDQRQEKAGEIYAERLQNVRTNHPNQYAALLQTCGFFETVAYVAHSQYVDVRDVINLLGGAILATGEVFETHIKKRHAEEGGDTREFEWLLWLLLETKAKQT